MHWGCFLLWSSVSRHPSMASVAEAAKHPVLRRFVLRKCIVQVGGSCLALVVPDARDWIRRGDWTAERLRGGEPPYWIQIWPAATAMARHLSRVASALPDPPRSAESGPAVAAVGQPKVGWPLAGMQVLDLGCGLGVPGCVASLFGGQVTFADQSSDALAFASWNALQLSGQQHLQQHLDWARQRTRGRFDLMLLADVSYHAKHHAPLLDHVANGLAPGGVVVHSDPFRSASTKFLTELSSRLPTTQGEVVIRDGSNATRVRVVVASASPVALQTWSRSLASRVRELPSQPSGHPARSCQELEGGSVRPDSRSEKGLPEHSSHGAALGSPAVRPTGEA
ncbi:MAG: class I SAM-dependent methyltransferase [Planctomycetota bacterium]